MVEPAATEDFFGQVEQAVPDVIFGTNQKFKADPSDKKLTLVIGAYRTEEGKPKVFEIVKKVEAEMLKEDLNKEYLSMEGDPEFVKCSRELIFGTDIPNMERICTLQALSGTGSLRVAGAFLKEYMPADTAVYFSDPTWGNHYRIFNHAGLTKHVKYPYYKASNNSLNIEGMLECLREAPRGSIILLHPCAHNPTGIDPTKDQWKMILQVIKEKELFTFFDSAYQGYATGDLEDDAYAIRLFAKEGAQFVLCQSYAKNAGLYGERIGAVHFGCANKETCAKVFSQAKLIVRGMYSNPPVHGARIMARIIGNPDNFAAWRAELKAVADRIKAMRKLLLEKLVANGAPGNWDHIVSQIGMFSFTGLTPEQCQMLMDNFHIYLLKSGRISISGINTKNVDYIADAIKAVVVALPKQ